MSNAAQIPTSFGHELRACLRCRLVKTYDQFRESGCENCPFFNMELEQYSVVDCTTPDFSGIIAVMDPSRSWAARWLRIGKFVPGCYALSISDVLSDDMQGLGSLIVISLLTQQVCRDNHAAYVPPKRV